ncbi:MAG: hypothetical protein ACI3XE_01830 [Eubacteriales bacterium]
MSRNLAEAVGAVVCEASARGFVRSVGLLWGSTARGWSVFVGNGGADAGSTKKRRYALLFLDFLRAGVYNKSHESTR